MKTTTRLLKLFALLLAGAAAAGCCVLPPFGHGHRGHGGHHYQNGPSHGQPPYPGAPRYLPGR